MKKSLLLLSFFLVACANKVSVTGEILVDFKDSTSENYITGLGQKLGITFVAESKYSSVDKIYIAHYVGTNEEEIIDSLRDDNEVESADIDGVMSLPEGETMTRIDLTGKTFNSSFPNDPLFSRQWHLSQIHLPREWSESKNVGRGVIVAVLDTGVAEEAEDLRGASFVVGYNFIEDSTNTHGSHPHGTFVSGCVAQNTNNVTGVSGIAYRATIMPIKVLSDQGSGSYASISQGIDFAVANHAKIINMSLGGGAYNSVMAKAIERAHKARVIVIAASGNSSHDKVSYPSAYNYVISVGATGPDEHVTSYSNYGKDLDLVAPGGMATKTHPDDGILQNAIDNGKDGYYSWNGTSFASPIVAGAAAMLVSAGITDPDEVESLLKSTARSPKDMIDSKPNDYRLHYGAGILDIEKAMSKTRPHYTMMKLMIAFISIIIIVYLCIRRKKN